MGDLLQNLQEDLQEDFIGNWIGVRLKLDRDIPGVYYIIKVESRNMCPICLKHQ